MGAKCDAVLRRLDVPFSICMRPPPFFASSAEVEGRRVT